MTIETAEPVTWTWPWTPEDEHWRLVVCTGLPPETFGGLEPFAIWELTVDGVREARSNQETARAWLAAKLGARR